MGLHSKPEPSPIEKSSADLHLFGVNPEQIAAGYPSVAQAKGKGIDDQRSSTLKRRDRGKANDRQETLQQSRKTNEFNDLILEWFKIFHLWDFITAEATERKPAWTTVTQYPLNVLDLYQRWKNHNELIGVRFQNGWEGNSWYLMLDIDTGSQYHPFNDPLPFRKLLTTLEEIGLCRCILIRSSNSKGLHIYFPLPKPVSCYKLALAARQTLEQAGFEVRGGQLEIFPNVKVYRSLYSAHRLPLQIGSFVLGENFQPVHNSIEQLVLTWNATASQQDIELLQQKVAVVRMTKKLIRGVLCEWKERLEGVIKTGWSGKGQTNRILMEVCIYARVFMHQDWDEVESWVLDQILQMPGYRDFCGHRTHIRKRIREWVTTNRKRNRYYPCQSKLDSPKPSSAPPNHIRSEDALQRIKEAIENIVAQFGELPDTVRGRQKLICETAKCSATTLRKYLELWHPEHQFQGCVTADAERVVDVSLGFFNILESDDELSSSQPECVTGGFAGVSDSSKDFLNNCSSTGSPTQYAVTGDRQLSVYSKLECQEEDRKQEFDQQIQFDLSNQKFLEITVRSTVKRKTDGALFQIRYINPNGTFWAKWLNQYVPLVGVILSEAEVELVSSGD